MMKSKYFVVPILIMAFVAVISAPPAHAELLTLTLILVGVFATSIVATEVIKSNSDTKTASNLNETEPIQQAKNDLENLEATQ